MLAALQIKTYSISHIFLKFQLDLSKTSNITAQYLASSTLCTFQNSSKIQCDKICPVCSEGRAWSPHMDLNLGLQGTKHSDCHTNEPGSIVWQSEHTLICSAALHPTALHFGKCTLALHA